MDCQATLSISVTQCDPTSATTPLHWPAPAAHAPDLDLQVHAGVATREVAHPTGLAVVESSLSPPTRPAGRFFPRRRSRKIRALGSPKMPRTVGSGRKPGNPYVSSSRRSFRIRVSCRNSHLEEKDKTLEIKGFRGPHRRFSTHSVGRRASIESRGRHPG